MKILLALLLLMAWPAQAEVASGIRGVRIAYAYCTVTDINANHYTGMGGVQDSSDFDIPSWPINAEILEVGGAVGQLPHASFGWFGHWRVNDSDVLVCNVAGVTYRACVSTTAQRAAAALVEGDAFEVFWQDVFAAPMLDHCWWMIVEITGEVE